MFVFIPNPTITGNLVLFFKLFTDNFSLFKFPNFAPVIPVIDT